MAKSTKSKTATPNVKLVVGTKKGAFVLEADASRRKWSMGKPLQLGHVVHHVVADPRKPAHWLMAARTGHLGPTLLRSTNRGKKWVEASKPPAFAKPWRRTKRAVDYTFWLTPSNASEPGVWYAGTSPQGLFRSEDHGDTWEEVEAFNQHKMLKKWTNDFNMGTPDGSTLHSILVHPEDAAHLYVSMSGGGTFESTDRGETWAPLNKGVAMDFAPPGDYDYGHDPHCVILHPADPSRLYQQNHCGIYRLDRPDHEWVRIGKKMPKKVGDIGFPVVGHPTDRDTAWVIPMDGSDVWPRISPHGKPAVYMTTNAGKSWVRQDKGLPAENAWLTVLRQAFASDGRKKVGLYFGTTSGEVWASTNGGESWKQIAAHLPRIQSLEVVQA